MANPIKLQATVTTISQHGVGVYEVHFRPSSRVPRFKAGQFLHLTLEEFDPTQGFWPESRVFSIASSYNTEKLCIVYSVKGAYTKRMEEELQVGKTFWLKLPYGDFSIDERSSDGDSVLIAGGTGISPFVPVLENYTSDFAQNAKLYSKIMLYFGVRGFESLLFFDLIKKQSRYITTTIASESELSNIGITWNEINVIKGRLNPEKILQETKDLTSPNFFLSGPPAMISDFNAYFLAQGINENKIHIDDWE